MTQAKSHGRNLDPPKKMFEIVKYLVNFKY
jgi:hypothetical protein